MKIIYSFNKRGFEAEFWAREIAAASGPAAEFHPFNHDPYMDPGLYGRAQLLDNLYYAKDERLSRLYADLTRKIAELRIDTLVVDNCSPYHPDWLRSLNVYKVLRISDGPISAYDRDFAYLHAYDQVLYHSPAYSADLDIRSKLEYCGARNIDFWPMAVFDAQFEPDRSEEEVFSAERDIDVIFIGALHLGKMPLLAQVKKALGTRCRIYGLGSWKRKAYLIARFGFPGWVRTIPADAYSALYRRAKIGFNVHNRSKYTVGNYRLFELPANGVMQVSDGGEYLGKFFDVGREIVGYESSQELIEKIRFYLEHSKEREKIARQGYRRALRDHRIRPRMTELQNLIRAGMERAGWKGLAALRRSP